MVTFNLKKVKKVFNRWIKSLKINSKVDKDGKKMASPKFFFIIFKFSNSFFKFKRLGIKKRKYFVERCYRENTKLEFKTQ